MKRFLLLGALLSMTACASWKSVPEKLDKFVEETEKTASGYSTGDWQASKDQFQALISEYSEHEDEYTPEEKAMVMKSIGRYHSMLIVNSLRDALAFLKTMIQILPSYWDGVKEVFEESLEENKREVSDIVRMLVDPNGVSGTYRGLVEDWDSLITDFSDVIDFALEKYDHH